MPEHDGGVALEFHMHLALIVAAAQGHAGGVQVAEHQRVVIQQAVGQRQRVGIPAHVDGLMLDQIAVQRIAVQIFLLVKDQIIILDLSRAGIGFVRAHAEVEGAVIQILDHIIHFQLVRFQAEHGPELIPEGEAGLLRRQKEGRFLLVGAFHRPLLRLGKAMLGHAVPLAVQLVAVVLKTSGHGEQNGRASLPDGGIALPEALHPVFVLNGLDLRAQRGNLHGQFFILQGNDAHSVTPLS